MRALVLPVGTDRYALPLGAVREVLPAPRPVPLPTAPAAVAGLLNVRGDVLALLATDVLLGLPASSPASHAVVVEVAAGVAALTTTALPLSAVLGPPVGAAGAPAGVALHTLDGGVVTLLDAELLVRAVARAGAGAGAP